MKYATALSAKAMKVLNRLDQKIGQRLQSRFGELAVNPLGPRISSQLETVEGQRYARVGDWRIVYEIRKPKKLSLLLPSSTAAEFTKN
jgi:mRNA-degrading endonuclease RelE of RelBE toxin-antitoxin system